MNREKGIGKPTNEGVGGGDWLSKSQKIRQ